MRIDGLWYLCDDGSVRPILRGEILTADGSWFKAPFLVDSGADRTALSADVLAALHLPAIQTHYQLAGVGGAADSVIVQTQLRFPRNEGGKAHFRGQFAGFTHVETLDMSVLGRDILNVFALIVDRPGATVCLLGQQHYYSIGKH